MYEINVARKGRHFFATAERSLQNYDDADDVYQIIKSRFPEGEGYEVTICKTHTTSRHCEVDFDMPSLEDEL